MPSAHIYRVIIHIINFAAFNGLVCIDVRLTTIDSGYRWSFGNCTALQEYRGNGTYTEKCCIEAGKDILICKGDTRNGWIGSFVSINGHTFCDDFVGYKGMRALEISGIHK